MNTRYGLVSATNAGHVILERTPNLTWDCVVTIPRELAEKHRVAGWFDFESYAEDRELDLAVKHLPCYSYRPTELQFDLDRYSEIVTMAEVDVWVVAGWNRLLPDWWTDGPVLGSHSSTEPHPHGPGRSPGTWAVALQTTRMFARWFWMTAGVDDGDVVRQASYPITPWDTTGTVQVKNCWVLADLLEEFDEHGPDPMARRHVSSLEVEWPKRDRDDQRIDWYRSADSICALVRASGRPLSGAWTTCDGHEFTIGTAVPLDVPLRVTTPGTVLHHFDAGWVVATGDRPVLINGCNMAQLDRQLKCGDYLASAAHPRKHVVPA